MSVKVQHVWVRLRENNAGADGGARTVDGRAGADRESWMIGCSWDEARLQRIHIRIASGVSASRMRLLFELDLIIHLLPCCRVVVCDSGT